MARTVILAEWKSIWMDHGAQLTLALLRLTKWGLPRQFAGSSDIMMNLSMEQSRILGEPNPDVQDFFGPPPPEWVYLLSICLHDISCLVNQHTENPPHKKFKLHIAIEFYIASSGSGDYE